MRVVRQEGPQLSLIDLPGVTHNAKKMKNIHAAPLAANQARAFVDRLAFSVVFPPSKRLKGL